MAGHWTYVDNVNSDDDLRQGDILLPTDALRHLFAEVHPYFDDEKYLGFLVVTQTCDLVRDRCAQYISVAAVRQLSAVVPGLLDTVCHPLGHSGVYNEKDRSRANDFLQRLFNQNEQRLGLFFLCADAEAGIGSDAVAFLRVSVSFQQQHYDTLRAARSGRLTEPFANKLGWLVGNLYARVGTDDWPAADLKRMVKAYLTGGPTWVPDKLLKQLKKQGIEPGQCSKNDLVSRANTKMPSHRDDGIRQIMTLLREAGIEDAALRRIETMLKSDDALRASFKDS